MPLLAHPIQIKPTLKLDFYETKQAFSIMGTIMANKMILFMVLGIGFAVGMPKLLVRRRLIAIEDGSKRERPPFEDYR